VNKSLAYRLKFAMELRSMKQVELHQRTHIPRSGISQYINGKIIPKQDKIFLLAEALNVSEVWLMGLSDEINDGEDEARLAPNERSLITDFRTLNTKGQDVALTMMKTIALSQEYTNKEVKGKTG
jgi:transcriptional regulator with XRE-family HTH domain